MAFTTGHGEHGLNLLPMSTSTGTQTNDYTEVKKALDKTYTVSTLDTTNGQATKDIDTLIIAGPQAEFTEKEAYQIDQFIMRGGKVFFWLMKWLLAKTCKLRHKKLGGSLLADYGVQINSDLVLDSQNENDAFNSGNMQFLLPYPLWPKLVKKTLNKNI